MSTPIRVKLLKSVYPLQDNIEIAGMIRFSSSYTKKVSEEVIKQKNSDSSLTPHFIFLIDTSYSMQEENKIGKLKESLKKFINYGYLDDVYLSIVVFDKYSQIILNYLNVSQNKNLIIEKIDSLEANGSQTYAYKGFKEIFDNITVLNRNSINKVIYFTDGDDFDTDYALKMIEKLVKEKRFLVTSVGIGEEYNADFLLEAADIGRGGFYHLNRMENFFDDIKEEIQHTYSETITNAEIVNIFYPSSVEIIEVYKVGKGVTKLDFDEKEIFCGHIAENDQIFFKLRIKKVKTPGQYTILNASLKYFVGNKEENKEFSFKVLLSNNQETLSNVSIDNEVVELNKIISLYKKVKKIQEYQTENNEKEIKRIINEISPLLKQISDNEDIQQIIDDIKNGKTITSEMTRTLLSFTRTKTITKTDTD